MSGTSLDGIDAALVAFSGKEMEPLATHYEPYAPALRNTLLELHQPATDELHRSQLVANQLAQEYAAATAALLKNSDTTADKILAIGCHGQTVRHRPDAGYTLQLGNAAMLAELTGITVVNDFRSRDIAAGGHGAPLTPAFHDQELRHPQIHRVIVNIGGISNLTDLPPGQPATGFDCGPGNMLLDAWIAQHCNEAFDRDGTWASSGNVIPALLQALLREAFFSAAPPKSSGRDLFNMEWLNRRLQGNEAPADVQATLLALTCHGIADAVLRHCSSAQEVYLCGGGARNTAMLKLLGQLLPDCRIQTTDALGVGVDWVEAVAFAWLARQALHGIPASLPAVTGARHPCILGAIHRA